MIIEIQNQIINHSIPRILWGKTIVAIAKITSLPIKYIIGMESIIHNIVNNVGWMNRIINIEKIERMERDTKITTILDKESRKIFDIEIITGEGQGITDKILNIIKIKTIFILQDQA